mgnify:CR=1 FL=1
MIEPLVNGPAVTEGIVPCGPAVAVKLVGVGVVATVRQE